MKVKIFTGDKYLKPVVISTPEIVILEITPEDECLIIASDGLWDVIPNELACNVARRCLAEAGPKLAERGLNNQTSAGAGPSKNEKDSVAPEAWCSMAAALLARLALGRRSTDNISVIVVDLRRC
ncbi:protein phosphatase 2C 37-like [Phalaenopsis equestris]|uniref:protein phosphatase 2C 37-like n=1 Tax=Phalaenopsis equestris TaxID=78828 RepID=UPI0009E32967|nr:protein phosphatase 2C 37-like [Phalaenopsis equestris]